RPYLLFDAGFQLSFAAAYTLGACLPWTEAKMKAAADRFKNTAFQTIGRAAAPGLAVYLGTAPLMAFHFSVFSPLSLLINPPAVAVTGLLLAFGLGMFIIFAAMGQGILLAMAAGPAQLLCRALALLNDAGARARGGTAAAAPPLTALLLYYLFFFYFFSETRYILCRRGLRSIALSIGLSLAVLGCALPRALNLSNSFLPWKYCEYSAVFLDVGQGDCMHIRAGKRNILIDGGGLRGSNIAEKVLRPYLLKNGVSRIDLAIVTHSDLDHSLGIKQLGEIFPVDRIAFPDCYRLKEEKTEGYNTEELLFLGAGDELVLSENVSLRVLSPAKGAEALEEENDNSLVIMLYADGIRILLTGDLTQEGELALLDSLRTPKDRLRCDVLKLAHHGSAGSSGEAFMEAASPSFAVISCGMNNSHGHPAKRVVDLLEKSYIIYGRTDFCGALCLRTGGHGTIFIENAAKDAKWLIIKEKGQRNTRSEPWEL
ncbi:MAG TPA: ComEC/Rec2 family competence protein, partial [Bacillota bacterium]|nr:ComEC/Rec2 family competence protein [Bacillota bacterium]